MSVLEFFLICVIPNERRTIKDILRIFGITSPFVPRMETFDHLYYP